MGSIWNWCCYHFFEWYLWSIFLHENHEWPLFHKINLSIIAELNVQNPHLFLMIGFHWNQFHFIFFNLAENIFILWGLYSDKAAFVLCKTSNPSSRDLQEIKLLNGEVMYESVAKLCNQWNKKSTETQNSKRDAWLLLYWYYLAFLFFQHYSFTISGINLQKFNFVFSTD